MRDDFDIHEWVKKVEEAKPRMDAMVKCLDDLTGVRVDPGDPMEAGALPYVITMFGEDVTVTVRMSLMDWQTDSDVVITNMTTFPLNERRKGFGRRAVMTLISWARAHNLKQVRATQVHSSNEGFWVKCGFVKNNPPNPCNDFVLNLK